MSRVKRVVKKGPPPIKEGDEYVLLNNGWAIKHRQLEKDGVMECVNPTSLDFRGPEASVIDALTAVDLGAMHCCLSKKLNFGPSWWYGPIADQIYFDADGSRLETVSGQMTFCLSATRIRYSLSLYELHGDDQITQQLYSTHSLAYEPWVGLKDLPPPVNEYAHRMKIGEFVIFRATHHLPGIGKSGCRSIGGKHYSRVIGIFRMKDISGLPDVAVPDIVRFLVSRKYITMDGLDVAQIEDKRPKAHCRPRRYLDESFYDPTLKLPWIEPQALHVISDWIAPSPDDKYILFEKGWYAHKPERIDMLEQRTLTVAEMYAKAKAQARIDAQLAAKASKVASPPKRLPLDTILAMGQGDFNRWCLDMELEIHQTREVDALTKGMREQATLKDSSDREEEEREARTRILLRKIREEEISSARALSSPKK